MGDDLNIRGLEYVRDLLKYQQSTQHIPTSLMQGLKHGIKKRDSLTGI